MQVDNEVLRLASEANAARNAYDSAICKSLTGIIYGRRLIQAVDALTAAIAEQAAQQATRCAPPTFTLINNHR